MNTQTVRQNERMLIAGLLAMMAFGQLVGCAKKDSTSTVSTGLVMTGSSGAATVAQDKSLWRKLLFPTAFANTPPALVDKSGATVVLNSAWVVIKEIEFEGTETAGAEDKNEISLTGPYYVNLVDPAATSLGEVTVPDSAIRRIKFKFHKSDATQPASVPAALSGYSIRFEGSVGGANFVYLADDSTEVQVGGPHGVLPSASSSLLVAVKMADLFKKIDMSGITVSTTISSTNRVPGANLCPLIDTSAADLYTCFRKGLESESKMGRDDDGSHELEVGEDEVHNI